MNILKICKVAIMGMRVGTVDADSKTSFLSPKIGLSLKDSVPCRNKALPIQTRATVTPSFYGYSNLREGGGGLL